jgi:DNA-binding response OmpR family regulator
MVLRLLLVVDDPKLREYLGRGLREQGIDCVTAGDAETALERIEEGATDFQLILLDVMLPGASGWEFLETLRAGGNQTPVIFLTARQAVDERIRGLRLGADDYIIKPFAFGELLARIESVQRRRATVPSLVLEDLRIDPVHRVVERGGQRIEVSPREFELLHVLAENPRRIMSRRELLERVWGIEHDPGTNVVDVAIARLRRRLDRGGQVPLLQTVVGSGYCLGEPAGEAS